MNSRIIWDSLIFLILISLSKVGANYTVYLQVSTKPFSGSAVINYMILKGNIGVSPLTFINTYANGSVNPNFLQDGRSVIIINKFNNDYGYINTVTVGNYGDSLTMQSANIYDNKRNLWSNMTFTYPIGEIQPSSSSDFLYSVNGSWSDWSSWGTCSVTCGNGTMTRLRSCNNPPAVNGGLPCNDSSTQWQICVSSVCPVNGNWTEWTSWGACSAICGSGTINRQRNCTNPPPSNGGVICSGSKIQWQICFNNSCPDLGLTEWSPWSDCTEDCGNGTQSRSRNCTGVSNSDVSCSGIKFEIQTCTNNITCPVNGQWSKWKDWSSCSADCGSNGTIERTRECNNPLPENRGQFCLGLSIEIQNCTNNLQNCTNHNETFPISTQSTVISTENNQPPNFIFQITILLNWSKYYNAKIFKLKCYFVTCE